MLQKLQGKNWLCDIEVIEVIEECRGILSIIGVLLKQPSSLEFGSAGLQKNNTILNPFEHSEMVQAI